LALKLTIVKGRETENKTKESEQDRRNQSNPKRIQSNWSHTNFSENPEARRKSMMVI
jgi:hypothetical protein